MSYDPVKAHEYYEQYRKKGLKKGRKKGKKKTSQKRTSVKKVSLIGLSSAGLNEAGIMEAAFIKERITNEMNVALAKTVDPIQKEQIRRIYQNQALTELTQLKSDAKYAKATKSSSSKSSSSKSSSSKSSSADKAKTREAEAKAREAEARAAEAETRAKNAEQKAKMIKQATDQADSLVKLISAKIGSMTPEQLAETKYSVQNVLTEIQAIYDNLATTRKRIEETFA